MKLHYSCAQREQHNPSAVLVHIPSQSYRTSVRYACSNISGSTELQHTLGTCARNAMNKRLGASEAGLNNSNQGYCAHPCMQRCAIGQARCSRFRNQL